MPIYVYEVIRSGGGGEVFEVHQSMSDEPLTRHPETGQPVRRIVQPPLIGGKHSSTRERNLLSDNNLSKMGFTKYVKSGNGSYEKSAGSGPSSLSAD